MNQHLKRWITGLVLTPLIFAFIFYSSENIFSFFVLVVIQLAVWELNTLLFPKPGYALEKGAVFIFAFIIPFSLVLDSLASLASVLTFCLFAAFLIFLWQIREAEIDISRLGKVIIGFMYLPVLLSYFILLRQLPKGVAWVFLTLFIAFFGDFFAFYVGRIIGKRKLQPLVSPGKTVEGALGMIVGSLLGSLLFRRFFFPMLPLGHAAMLGICGGILGQLGDLFESAIKRSSGVKDAGFLFPGHGGIMDRLDSISFIAPFVFYYQHFVIR